MQVDLTKEEIEIIILDQEECIIEWNTYIETGDLTQEQAVKFTIIAQTLIDKLEAALT